MRSGLPSLLLPLAPSGERGVSGSLGSCSLHVGRAQAGAILSPSHKRTPWISLGHCHCLSSDMHLYLPNWSKAAYVVLFLISWCSLPYRSV